MKNIKFIQTNGKEVNLDRRKIKRLGKPFKTKEGKAMAVETKTNETYFVKAK